MSNILSWKAFVDNFNDAESKKKGNLFPTQVREKTTEEKEAEEAAAEAEDEAQVYILILIVDFSREYKIDFIDHIWNKSAQANYSEFNNYKQMVELMRPGESVAKTLRRLGGGQKVTQEIYNVASNMIQILLPWYPPGSEPIPKMEEEEGRSSRRP